MFLCVPPSSNHVIVSLTDDEGSPWSIVVRYQNVCHNIKIRCNNSSALALAFLRLLRFSLRLAFLGLTLRLALSFRWRAAVLLGPFPLLPLILTADTSLDRSGVRFRC